MEQAQRTALVMAGSGGLGHASALALVDAGLRVAICGRDASRLEQALRVLTSVGSAVGFVGDVSRPEELTGVVEKTRSEFGSIDVLVANAGGPPAGTFSELGSDQWERAFELTFQSVVNGVRLVASGMQRNGHGRIVVVGSSSIRRPILGLTTSNALRPALNGLVKDLAIEFASDGITVNMVAPGRIDTTRVRELDQLSATRAATHVDAVRRRSWASIPMRRYGTPAEFAAAVRFFASPEASYITGQSLLVDGGATASLP
jgi:3-oxoacyl-[acyl-carrier protein] reductase